MAIPSYKYLRYAFLKYASDGEEHHIKDTQLPIADYFGLSDEDVEKLTSNGRYREFDYRLRWVKTYLTKAELIESTGRGTFRITELGQKFLNNRTEEEITRTELMQFDSFAAFASPSKIDTNEMEITDSTSDGEQDPLDTLNSTYNQLMTNLADEVLETVLSVSPAFFEKLVVDLLLAMGYGSSLDSGESIGRSGDGGIDGIIREDKLGLDNIYIQAKRWAKDNGVGRPEIQGFVGSLMGMGATKGVFITTSYFSDYARQYAANVPNLRVILIDGKQLATLMIEHSVGVTVQKTYVVKQVDENYFPDV